MPKEQPCLSEHSPCATSSKNAKDQSNSTTLLAIRNTKDAGDSGGRGSHWSSEKDSGYSDGSDWQQTDVEDQRRNKSQSRGGSERAETSQPGRGNPAGPLIYIINNMVLQQPDMIQKRGQLPRRNGNRETDRILSQQPSSLPAAVQLHRPTSRKPSAAGKKINAAHLPVLNSYARIAPHPSKKPPDKSSSNDEPQNLSKRMCTEHKSDNAPEQHLYKQPKLAEQGGKLTSGPPCSSSTRASLPSSSPTTVSSSQGSRGLHRNTATRICHRRFLNTVEVLKRSGLLDITLRTRELLRQSNATERDIAQLRQHSKLLCQAASNPSCSPSGVAAWEHLHRAMAESGSYPDLKITQKKHAQCRPDSASQPEGSSTGEANEPPGADNSEEPPPRLFTAVPDLNHSCPEPQQSLSGHGRELEAGKKSSENVTFMPPDSSTG